LARSASRSLAGGRSRSARREPDGDGRPPGDPRAATPGRPPATRPPTTTQPPLAAPPPVPPPSGAGPPAAVGRPADGSREASEGSGDRAVDDRGAADGLARLVGPVHRDAARLAAWASDAVPGADPRQTHRAGDAAVAAMCAHLATMGYVVYPEMARLQPHTEGRIARLRAGAREMMMIMRGVQQYAQGDTKPPGSEVTELRRELAEAIVEHSRDEEDLLREFDRASTPDERRMLADEYERALSVAPSRPHPHLLRTRRPLGGRLGYRLVARFDYLLDTMDARIIPGAKVRGPGQVGPWGTWLLGRPPQATTTGSAPGPDESQPVTSATRPPG